MQDWEVHGTGFTIHFATINTYYEGFIEGVVESFTIHFATINTLIKNQLYLL